MTSETYIPVLDGAVFHAALRRNRFQAERMLRREAYEISQFCKGVLRSKNLPWFSVEKGRLRREVFGSARAALLDEVGDFGPFDLTLHLGRVLFRDLEKVEARRTRKDQERAAIVSSQAAPLFLNSRTGQTRTADEKNMDILFGRAYPDEFEKSGQSI